MKLLALAVPIIYLLVLGCGGTDPSIDSDGSGSLQLKIQWPSTRDIPPATRSLRVTAKTLVKNDSGQKVEDKTVADKVVARPEDETSSTVILEDLPSVEVRIQVLAYASTEATGDPLAIGLKDTTISSGATTIIAITLQSPQGCFDPTSSAIAGDAEDTGTTSAIATDGAATASVNLMNVTTHITGGDGNHAFARYLDGVWITPSAPANLIFVFEATTAVSGEDAEYSFEIFSPQTLPEMRLSRSGSMRDGEVVSGEPPINGELSIAVPFTFAANVKQGISLQITTESKNFFTGDTVNTRLRFKRIEGLSAGSTLQTASCTGWLAGI
jgi:hypothetical protein